MKKRLFTSISLFVCIFLAGFAGLILNPHVLYAHSVEIGKFTVYADEPIDSEVLVPFLALADAAVSESELADASYTYRIVFAHKTPYNRLDNLIFDPYAAARPTANTIIVKAPVDWQAGEALTDQSRIGFAYLFAHEMMHCLQAHKYGLVRFNPFTPPPMWKLEGYPEYISQPLAKREQEISLKEGILMWEQAKKGAWIQASDTHFVPPIYFKSWLMTRFLMEEKGWTYDQILEKGKEGSVFEEMQQAFRDTL